MTSILVVGPGRAGSSIALAAQSAGHTLRGVVGRARPDEASELLDCPAFVLGDVLPTADVCFISVSDDAIGEVADSLAGRVAVDVVAHLSGATSIEILSNVGPPYGSFHPLQSLPTPEIGRAALVGAGAAVTGSSDQVVAMLTHFGISLGCRPFALEDHAKPTYHAAASAASNFVTMVLGVSGELFDEAGVDPGVAEALTLASVRNAYLLGAAQALTGPVARGDIETVAAQIRSAEAVSADLGATFAALVEATSRLADKDDHADS